MWKIFLIVRRKFDVITESHYMRYIFMKRSRSIIAVDIERAFAPSASQDAISFFAEISELDHKSALPSAKLTYGAAFYA